MNRKEVLQQAEQCITQDRAATHGDAEDSFSSIAALVGMVDDPPRRRPADSLRRCDDDVAVQTRARGFE